MSAQQRSSEYRTPLLGSSSIKQGHKWVTKNVWHQHNQNPIVCLKKVILLFKYYTVGILRFIQPRESNLHCAILRYRRGGPQELNAHVIRLPAAVHSPGPALLLLQWEQGDLAECSFRLQGWYLHCQNPKILFCFELRFFNWKGLDQTLLDWDDRILIITDTPNC